MKKLAYLFAGMVAFGLCSCSSDEPSTPEGNIAKGDVAYLNVNIVASGNNSRASEGEFLDGISQEHTIDSAHFFFFDEQGNFELKSNIWNGGDENKPNNDNVEYLGNNTVVLTGLTGKNYPTWVVTVLNKPDEIDAKEGTTLEQFKEQLTKCTNGTGDKTRFVMSTTSYYGDETYYYATKLSPDDFSTQPTKDFNALAKNPVQIYVERLAAAVEVKAAVTSNTAKGDMYEVKVSIAGENNPETGNNTGIAAEKVYIKFLGWDLNATARKSTISKGLQKWTFANSSWANVNDWNKPDYKRSYWGMSTTYGKTKDKMYEGDADETLIVAGDKTWNTLNYNVGNGRAYCNETTNRIENITVQSESVENQYLALPNATPTVLLKAQICDENGNALNLVNYRGINYLWDNFIVKALEVANPNLYYEVKTINTDNGGSRLIYTQIGKDHVKVDSVKGGTGMVKLVLKNSEGVLYCKHNGGNTYDPKDYDEVDASEVNSKLAEATNSTKAIAYNNGMTYYTIPIEHLNNPTGVSTSALNKFKPVEGQYGVVRNHIYQIAIKKISSLGNGVFDSDEKLVPETPKDPTYYLESQINILSWKVVSQEAEI